MPEVPEKRFPTWSQVLMLVLGGGLLGFTSCGAALTVSGRGSAFWRSVFAVGFFAGAAAFLAGLLLFLFLVLRAMISR